MILTAVLREPGVLHSVELLVSVVLRPSREGGRKCFTPSRRPSDGKIPSGCPVPYCWDPLCCQVSDEGIVATYTVLQPHTGLTKRGKHLL